MEPRCSLVFLLTGGIVAFSVATPVAFNLATDIGRPVKTRDVSPAVQLDLTVGCARERNETDVNVGLDPSGDCKRRCIGRKSICISERRRIRVNGPKNSASAFQWVNDQ